MYRSPEQLETEADDLLRQAGQLPPETDSEAEVDGAQPKVDPIDETPPAEVVVDTDTPPDGSEAEAPVVTATPSPDATDTDELTGLTLENAEERIRNAQARMHKATKDAADAKRESVELKAKLKTVEGQIAAVNTELAQLKANPPAPVPESDDDVTKTYDSLEALKSDYPNLIEPVLASLTALQETQRSLKQQVIALGGQVTEAKTAAATRATEDTQDAEQKALAAHFKKITDVHADAFKIVKADDFQGWLDRQTPMSRRIIDVDGSAEEVIEVITKYKKDVGSARVDTARKVATPATPTARTQPVNKKPKFTRESIKAMSAEEYAKHEKDIDAAMAAGEIQ